MSRGGRNSIFSFFKNMYHVILDLDNTIISSVLPKEKKNACEPGSLKQYENFSYRDDDGGDRYTFFVRPGLQEFLTWLFERCFVSVWTAATESYAQFVMDNIVVAGRPERKIYLFMHRRHCDLSQRLYQHQKKLEMLWKHWRYPEFNELNTLIIDDREKVCERQRKLCYKIAPFDVTRCKTTEPQPWPEIKLEIQRRIKKWVKK